MSLRAKSAVPTVSPSPRRRPHSWPSPNPAPATLRPGSPLTSWGSSHPSLHTSCSFCPVLTLPALGQGDAILMSQIEKDSSGMLSLAPKGELLCHILPSSCPFPLNRTRRSSVEPLLRERTSPEHGPVCGSPVHPECPRRHQSSTGSYGTRVG